MKPYGIAATLSDAVALTAAFGPPAKIGIGQANARDCNILAPAGPYLTASEAQCALGAGASQYVFTFGNTETTDLAGIIGPVIDLLATASGTGFLPVCLATPWAGRSVYQGHLFAQGSLQSDLKRELAAFIDGRIAIVPHAVIAAGAQAIRTQLTSLKEQGARVALLDAIDDEHCGFIAEAVAPLPVVAGPAWISPQFAAEPEQDILSGPIAILSGALRRQTLIQTAAARNAMPVLDVDLGLSPDAAAAQALAWARPHFQAPFLITSTVPPDKIRHCARAPEIMAAIAESLAGAGIRNFVLAGNDTAAAVLDRLGITELVAGASFAGLRWLHAADFKILIKPGFYGAKNLFLYEFEPQSRLNATAV